MTVGPVMIGRTLRRYQVLRSANDGQGLVCFGALGKLSEDDKTPRGMERKRSDIPGVSWSGKPWILASVGF